MKKTICLLLTFVLLLSAVPTALAAGPVFTDTVSAGEFVRAQMKNRAAGTEFVIRGAKKDIGEYTQQNVQSFFRSRWDEISNVVYAYTGDGAEGDYLHYHCALGYEYHTGSFYDSDPYLDFKVTLTSEYHTTAAQEKQVTAAVDEAMASLALAGKSDYEKVSAITAYIRDRAEYDYDHVNDDTYSPQYTAYGAIVLGRAVCQGYANLFYRMATEAGLNCRIVGGEAGKNGDRGPHSWNIVQVDGVYYFHDVTWFDTTDGDEAYFLSGAESMAADHFPDDMLDLSLFHISDTAYAPALDSETDLWRDYAATEFTCGSGTEQDPYLISSAAELALLAKLVNGGDVSYAGAYYVQTCDIDLAGHGWVPIGDLPENAFRGIYNGCGFAVKNMRIENLFNLYLGLFGVNGGTVGNLAVRQAEIEIKNKPECPGSLFAGVLCGAAIGEKDGDETQYAYFVNCAVENAAVDLRYDRHVVCGGICGYAEMALFDKLTAGGRIRIDTGGYSLCAGGAVGAMSSDSLLRRVHADADMYVQNDSSGCDEGLHQLHCAGGLVGFFGYDSSHIMLGVTHVGHVLYMDRATDVRIVNCSAAGQITSVHTGDPDAAVGQILGRVGPVTKAIAIYNVYAQVYLSLSGGDETDDRNNTGAAGYVYSQFADSAETAVFYNIYEKDFTSPGFSAYYYSQKELTEFSSTDGYIYQSYTWDGGEYVPVGDERGYVAHTGRDQYAVYYVGTTYVIPTEDFAHDVLYLPEEEWVNDGDFAAKLSFLAQEGCLLHTWDNGTARRAATCVQDGSVDYTCTVCGAVYTAEFAGAHRWDGGTDTVKASCTAGGKRTYTCTLCGKTKTEDVPAAGHALQAVAASPATCTVNGCAAHYRCKVCKKTFYDAAATVELSFTTVTATGHVEEAIPATPATQTKSGLTAGVKCAVCGEILTPQRVIPAGQAYRPGDVDADGSVTAADARLALRRAVGLEPFAKGSAAYLACDANADGDVTAADARLILRAAVGLERL